MNYIPHVVVYLDDILVTGKNKTAHLNSLSQVLDRLDQAGLQESKCKFMAKSVVLGHVIEEQGIRLVKEKVQVIREAPMPRKISELKSYLGLIS